MLRPSHPTRVGLYARVSTDQGKQDPENQILQMKDYISRRKDDGWSLTDSYVDYMTGGTDERPQFKRLFTDIRHHKFDLVFFWSLDRFSREGTLKTLELLRQLTDSGVGYFSFTEQYLDSCGPFKDAVIAILACIAKQERLRMGERVKAGIARRKAAGKQVGGQWKQIDEGYFIRACRVGFTLNELAKSFDMSVPTALKYRRRLCPDWDKDTSRSA